MRQWRDNNQTLLKKMEVISLMLEACLEQRNKYLHAVSVGARLPCISRVCLECEFAPILFVYSQYC